MDQGGGGGPIPLQRIHTNIARAAHVRVINLGKEKPSRRRIREIVAEDELDMETAFYVGGVLWEGQAEGGREGGRS